MAGKRDNGFDIRTINGIKYYAWGEYRNGAIGLNAAKKEFNRMKKNGHKARIIKHVTGYQVYCDSTIGVMGS